MSGLRIAVVGRAPAAGPVHLGDFHLAVALADAGHRVTWVDPPLRWGRRRPGRVPAGVEVVVPRVPPGAGAELVASAVDGVVARAARAHGRVDLVLVGDPRRAGVGARIGGATTIYWCRDQFAAAGDRHDFGAERERRFLPTYDVVTGVSPGVVASLADVVPGAVVVPNGCDAAHFATTPSPDADGPPTLGFLGGVGWRVDVTLLEAVARRRADWRVVVIGEVSSGSLPDLPNLEHRGRVPYWDVPAALAPVDVGWVPYVDDAFNRASFPLKVFEYLAAGRPVVSSPIDALSGMEPYVRVAAGVDATIAAVGEALRGPPSEQECRRVGGQNSWAHRASQLLVLAGFEPLSPEPT